LRYDDEGDLEPDSIIPLVDGGTEAFKGQARFFLYPFYSCFECSQSDAQTGFKFDLCTIRNLPRIAEHCIAHALVIQWPWLEEFKSHTVYKLGSVPKDSDKTQPPNRVSLDKDNPEHMTWIYERAKERANQYNIEGVTYNLTMQYVKNIIPAIASTNALISAACTNEAIKYLTKSSPIINNYYFYNGQSGTYSRTFEYKKNPECFTCGSSTIKMQIKPDMTLGQLKEAIDAKYNVDARAFVTHDEKTLYNRGLGITEALAEPLNKLVPDAGEIAMMAVKKGASNKAVQFPLFLSWQ